MVGPRLRLVVDEADLGALAAVLVPLIAARLADGERRKEARGQEATSPYMTVTEAADYLRCREQRVRELLSQRRLSRFKDGARTLLLREEVEEYVRRSAVPRT